MVTPYFTPKAGAARTGPGNVMALSVMPAAFCIVDPTRLDSLLTLIYAAIERQIGIVSVSDVEVVRPDRF